MGLINYARSNIPYEWDKAATKMRMKTELLLRICANVPNMYKNKYHYKEGRRYIRNIFQTRSCSILHLIDVTGLTEKDLEKWQDLNNKIKEYEHQCK